MSVCMGEREGNPSSSEQLIRTQAQLLVEGGYLAAGYEYIIIDDCWLNHTRAPVSGRKDHQLAG